MKQNAPTTAIMVFARAPVPGQVKTRLIPALGEAGAAELHAALLEQTLKTASQLEDSAIRLYCQPDTQHSLFRQMADRDKLTLHPQDGNDLGERMSNAFADNLPHYQKVLVIGCDCPALTPDDLRAVIEALDKQDAVIIPAHDGGYVLLGLRTFSPLIFSDIDWSTDRVCEQTTRQLDAAGLQWTALEPRPDIDRPEDLIHCPEHLLTGVTNEMAG
ncbi:TIGR04282 family arsenosugar biosynthesis glycosyltransferase [Thiohalophilus sp.]|uniref:TIGR04282 family arsenosugar biosynthesis glycosyltransferase n=1 Tax=Thiohalophilus sp. TaxID=3028392 RepID=UPI003975E0FB